MGQQATFAFSYTGVFLLNLLLFPLVLTVVDHVPLALELGVQSAGGIVRDVLSFWMLAVLMALWGGVYAFVPGLIICSLLFAFFKAVAERSNALRHPKAIAFALAAFAGSAIMLPVLAIYVGGYHGLQDLFSRFDLFVFLNSLCAGGIAYFIGRKSFEERAAHA